MVANKFLTSQDQLTNSIVSAGIDDFRQLIKAVHSLPYGRNSNRADPSLVWIEQRGTCSSKHAFLKVVAEANDIKKIVLKVCIFKMNAINTPAISDILTKYQVSYIPEAHCYLQVDEQALDVTFADSNINKLKNDILVEKSVPATFVISAKVEYHKDYIAKWLQSEGLPYDLDDFWNIREQCIEKLANKSSQ